MTRVCLCGSSKFIKEIKETEAVLEAGGVSCSAFESACLEGITGCLEKIDSADAVYVVNPDGYLGKSVALELGYAFARGVPVYLMHPIDDPPLTDLVEDCCSPEDFIHRLDESETP